MDAPLQDGLRIVDTDVNLDAPPEDGQDIPLGEPDPELEALRDEFVDAFNARDVDALLSLLAPEVECPDRATEGANALLEEFEGIWERSPGVLLTRAFLDDAPCAAAWLPDGEGCWTRAALVCFDASDSVIELVSLVEETDALERAISEDPEGDELEEGTDWREWETGEEAVARTREQPPSR